MSSFTSLLALTLFVHLTALSMELVGISTIVGYSMPNPFYHHHHVVPLTQISLTLSRHFSLSFIASVRSSGLHPVSSYSCCMYVLAGHPAFAQPYVGSIGVHHLWACLCFSSSVLRVFFMMAGRWPYSWCFVGCCCQDLFNIACNILV